MAIPHAGHQDGDFDRLYLDEVSRQALGLADMRNLVSLPNKRGILDGITSTRNQKVSVDARNLCGVDSWFYDGSRPHLLGHGS